MLKLISATPSPYARKVRIALAEKGIPFELQTEVPWHGTTETPRYNPLEKLPVLILENGEAVYESRYILEYLEAKYPDPPLLPADVDAMLLARKFEVLCDGTCDAFVLMFFEQMRDKDRQSPEWIARQRRKVDGGMREIARLVGDRDYAVGDGFTLGDIAAGTVAGYLTVRWPDYPWRDQYPSLAAYADRIERRPSFRDTVPVPQTITEKVV